MHTIVSVVLHVYANTIQEFDIACCGVAYDGRAVWCTHRAREAIATGVNVIDLDCRYTLSSFFTINTVC